MRLSSVFAAVLSLSIPVLAAKSKKNSHAQLVDLAAAAPGGNIQLDEHTFDLLTSSNRNWTAAVQFTALDPRRRCNPCREFNPSWTAVASSWKQVPSEDKDSFFFGTLDFDASAAVFQKLGIASAPVVHIYPPTEGPRAPASGRKDPIRYDFTHGFDAEPLAQSLSLHTPRPIPYVAPFDYARYTTILVFLLASALSARALMPYLTNRWVWAAGVISTSLVMVSGQMFVQIRGMPYAGHGGQKIAPGFQQQFGDEVHFISIIYGLLSLAFLGLTMGAPLQTRSKGKQSAAIYLLVMFTVIVFSSLVKIFKIKNGSYPFSILF